MLFKLKPEQADCRFEKLEQTARENESALLADLQEEAEKEAAKKHKKTHRGQRKKKKGKRESTTGEAALNSTPQTEAQDHDDIRTQDPVDVVSAVTPSEGLGIDLIARSPENHSNGADQDWSIGTEVLEASLTLDPKATSNQSAEPQSQEAHIQTSEIQLDQERMLKVEHDRVSKAQSHVACIQADSTTRSFVDSTSSLHADAEPMSLDNAGKDGAGVFSKFHNSSSVFNLVNIFGWEYVSWLFLEHSTQLQSRWWHHYRREVMLRNSCEIHQITLEAVCCTATVLNSTVNSEAQLR